jgi:TRAP-type mannitol/chloroaromatic compound transport system permease large subunit
VLIIMADQLGKSVGDMYEGRNSFPADPDRPFYVGYVVCWLPHQAVSHCPALPPEARTLRRLQAGMRVLTFNARWFRRCS